MAKTPRVRSAMTSPHPPPGLTTREHIIYIICYRSCGTAVGGKTGASRLSQLLEEDHHVAAHHRPVPRLRPSHPAAAGLDEPTRRHAHGRLAGGRPLCD